MGYLPSLVECFRSSLTHQLGEHVRTLNADHTQLINWQIGLTRTGFDSGALYREIVTTLAKAGL